MQVFLLRETGIEGGPTHAVGIGELSFVLFVPVMYEVVDRDHVENCRAHEICCMVRGSLAMMAHYIRENVTKSSNASLPCESAGLVRKGHCASLSLHTDRSEYFLYLRSPVCYLIAGLTSLSCRSTWMKGVRL